MGYKGKAMKKFILAGLLAVSASFGASATVLDFDDSSFNDGSFADGVTFDGMDLSPSVGTVTQTGANFVETGILGFTNFMIGLNPVFPTGFPAFKGYEVLMDYTLNGTAGLTGTQIDITFAGGSANLYADTNIDGSIAGADLLGSLSLQYGTCTASVTPGQTGSCDIRMGFTPVAGYFDLMGFDLLTHKNQGAGIWFDFAMTVQNIVGFNAAGTPFTVEHDGNVTVSVPEPTSIAILGLGLLGLAGARRRKS